MPCTVRRHWVRLRPSMDGYVCDGPWNSVGPVTMTEAIERLQQATFKVATLVKEHEQLRQRHARAEEDLGTQRRTNEVLSKRVTELEQENEVLRTVQSKQKDVPPQAKERIDELVSEIDRCLALISG
ncbi:MAG: hypothetical protein IPG74_04625 [Flavobacteriales bacterium]|nr:hypothetical protein [Flavobacteriales bacterium]